MAPSCPLGIAHFDPAQEKKITWGRFTKFVIFWQSWHWSPKDGRRQSNGETKVYFATKTVGFLSLLLK